jgi:hypothetical protein
MRMVQIFAAIAARYTAGDGCAVHVALVPDLDAVALQGPAGDVVGAAVPERDVADGRAGPVEVGGLGR